MGTGSDEAIFEAMRQRYRQVLRLMPGPISRSLGPRDIPAWQARLTQMKAQEEAARAAGGWLPPTPDFIFDAGGLSEDRGTRARQLAWLLDPSARHRRSPEALRRLLERAGIAFTPPEPALAVLQTSVVRDGCVADLLIGTTRRWILVDAGLPRPESRHAMAYDLLFLAFVDAVDAFICLSPEGEPPPTRTGLAPERFSTLSFAELAEILSGPRGSDRGPADADADRAADRLVASLNTRSTL